MFEADARKSIKVVGANPNGGGVLTYIKNLQSGGLMLEIYGYKDYYKFYRELGNYDTIFFNVVKPSLFYFILSFMTLRCNLRRVYCGHGLNYKYYSGLKSFIVKQAERFISLYSDSVIVLNEIDLMFFEKWNSNSVLIPTCLKPVALKFPYCDSINIRAKSTNRGKVWIAVGSVETRKDPMYFVKIAREIQMHFPNDLFTWIGKGPLLDEFINEVRYDSRISFVGGLSNSDVRALMCKADIFICTSKYEVLPISILEAVEGGLILVIRDYYYSGDVFNRFSSSVLFHSIDELLVLRMNSDKFKYLELNAKRETLSLEADFEAYMVNMKKVLC